MSLRASVVPADLEDEVPRNSTVVLRLRDPAAPERELRLDMIDTRSGERAAGETAVSPDDRTVTFVPEGLLEPNTHYSAPLSRGRA